MNIEDVEVANSLVRKLKTLFKAKKIVEKSDGTQLVKLHHRGCTGALWHECNIGAARLANAIEAEIVEIEIELSKLGVRTEDEELDVEEKVGGLDEYRVELTSGDGTRPKHAIVRKSDEKHIGRVVDYSASTDELLFRAVVYRKSKVLPPFEVGPFSVFELAVQAIIRAWEAQEE